VNLFVTGTDTGVGKTFVSCLLIRALRTAGVGAVGFKPIVCGGREDAAALAAASGGAVTVDEVNPLWLKTPAAPVAASMIEDRPVEPGALLEAYQDLSSRFPAVVVEGVGGWEVPVCPGYSMADFAGVLGLPVAVVVHNKLGALNHTLLTVNAVRGRGLPCAGVILNDVAPARDSASISNRRVLDAFLPEGVPIVLEVMHGETEVSLPATLAG
jgi:dethiobiotin synthetase